MKRRQVLQIMAATLSAGSLGAGRALQAESFPTSALSTQLSVDPSSTGTTHITQRLSTSLAQSEMIVERALNRLRVTSTQEPLFSDLAELKQISAEGLRRLARGKIDTPAFWQGSRDQFARVLAGDTTGSILAVREVNALQQTRALLGDYVLAANQQPQNSSVFA